MACKQCLLEDEEILATRKRFSEMGLDWYSYDPDDLPSRDCNHEDDR